MSAAASRPRRLSTYMASVDQLETLEGLLQRWPDASGGSRRLPGGPASESGDDDGEEKGSGRSRRPESIQLAVPPCRMLTSTGDRHHGWRLNDATPEPGTNGYCIWSVAALEFSYFLAKESTT